MGFSIHNFNKEQFIKGYQLLFIGTAFFVNLTLFFFINNIETYSQGAAIEFFESKANEDCYVVPSGYKSYGHLFYTQKPPVQNQQSYTWEWLVKGNVDKPVYVITKVHKTKALEKEKNLQEIGRKNGFVFYKRIR